MCEPNTELGDPLVLADKFFRVHVLAGKSSLRKWSYGVENLLRIIFLKILILAHFFLVRNMLELSLLWAKSVQNARLFEAQSVLTLP